MAFTDIGTEARRLGELETAFIRQANEIVALRNRCENLEAYRRRDALRFANVYKELIEMSGRVAELEAPRHWWQRPPWWRA